MDKIVMDFFGDNAISCMLLLIFFNGIADAFKWKWLGKIVDVFEGMLEALKLRRNGNPDKPKV